MTLEEANLNQINMIQRFAENCLADGILRYRSAVNNPSLYLSVLVANKQADSNYLKPKQSPFVTYFAVDEGEIHGAIRVRLNTTARIQNVYGHIGYETQPSSRNKGVAKFLLESVRDLHCKNQPLVVACNTDNVTSKRVIESCGGMAPRVISDEKYGEVVLYNLGLS